MKPRGLAKNLLLTLASLLVLAVAGEIVVRAGAALGMLNDGSPTFRAGVEQQKSRPSGNDVLKWELDPSAPDVNADGMRDRDYALVAPAGTLRIAVLGDSVAYGQGVHPEEGFSAVLARLLDEANPQRRHEVMNFGVGGYNTLQEAEQYRVRARKYSPDVAVLAYVLNDPLPAVETLKAVTAMKEGADTVGDVELAPCAASFSHLARFLGSRTHELKNPELRDAPRYPLIYHEKRENWRVVTRGMARLAAQTRGAGTPVVVMIVPMWVPFDPYRFEALHAQVAAEARKHGFEVLDPLREGAFAGFDGPELQLAPGDVLHPNVEGHRRLAESLARFLAERGLVAATEPR